MKQELPLREFWLKLGTEPKRAKAMRVICEVADYTYDSLKLVMLKERGLSVQAAKRIHKAAADWAKANKFDYIISMSDLYEICGQEVKDKRKR